jgi:insulysin
MIEFFKQYIDPSSPARAKLAVHLNALTQVVNGNGVTSVLEKGMKALGLKQDDDSNTASVNGLNKGRKDDEDGEIIPVKPEGNGTTPYVITDVREFKSMLQVSAGPQPVKHISEFEDTDSKL